MGNRPRFMSRQGNIYYFIDYNDITYHFWVNSAFIDYPYFSTERRKDIRRGNCFKTREDGQKMLDKWMKLLKKGI